MTQPSSDNQLERDLQHAQQFGRWLSDEEAARLAEEEEARSDVVEQREVGRRKLIILIALSVLIPPLWPLALVLTLVLLYPDTMKRIGLIGGVIGAIAFLIAMSVAGELPGRFIGTAVLGFTIGLVVALVERLAREAALIVHWDPNEQTVMNLGPEPVILGSGDDVHLYLPRERGFPDVAALVTFKDGVVQMDNKLSGSVHTLHGGNKLEIGTLIIEIQTDVQN